MIHLSGGGAFLAEVILTAIFVYVILTVTGKTGSPLVAGLVIGLALAVVNLVGIPLDGASANPARSLSPAVITGGTALSQVWLFIVAPLVGAVVAAVLDRVINSERKHADVPRQMAREATGVEPSPAPSAKQPR